MKKVVKILLFSLLILLVLAACDDKGGNSKSNGNNDSVTLTFFSWDGEDKMKPLLEGFKEAHPEIEIEFSHAPPIEGYISNLQTRLLSDSAADVFMMAAENRNDLIDGDYVLDLTDEPLMENISDANKATYSGDGKVYAMSVSAWGGGIFYNKKIFEEAGVEANPETWDEFIELSKKLKESGVTPIYDSYEEIPMILSAFLGTEVILDNPDFDEQLFNGETTFSEGWKPVLDEFYRLFEENIISESVLGLNNDQILNEFINENVAMLATGPWNINAIEEGNPDLEFGVMPIPGVEEGRLFAAGAASPGYAINKDTENVEAAKTFLEYISSSEGLEKNFEGLSTFITASGYESESHPSIAGINDLLLEDRYYLPHISWPEHNNALSHEVIINIQELALGTLTTDELAEKLDAKLDELTED